MTASLFEVVAEPHRRRILDALRDGDRSVTDLVGLLGLAQPTVSKHLQDPCARHSSSWCVRRPSAGGTGWPGAAARLDHWLEPYRRAWERRLDALGDHLDEMEENDD